MAWGQRSSSLNGEDLHSTIFNHRSSFFFELFKISFQFDYSWLAVKTRIFCLCIRRGSDSRATFEKMYNSLPLVIRGV